MGNVSERRGRGRSSRHERDVVHERRKGRNGVGPDVVEFCYELLRSLGKAQAVQAAESEYEDAMSVYKDSDRPFQR